MRLNAPNEGTHVNGNASKVINHGNLRSARVLVTAESPSLLAIVVVDVEDGKVVGVEVMAGGNVTARLRNPSRAPVVPVGVSRVKVVQKTLLQPSAVDAGVHLRLVLSHGKGGHGQQRGLVQHDDGKRDWV